MNVRIFESKIDMGSAAAKAGADSIRAKLANQGEANIILATGASQFEMMSALVAEPGIDWSKVTCFHLDEYVGLSIDHPASFRKYLKERFVDQVPSPVANFHFVNGEVDAEAECKRLSKLISQVEIDVAFIGIGENAHLAFNDPPADFETDTPYLIVELDEACRQQQFGEGWFDSFELVPKTAISMSIRQIMKSNQIVCTVPDERKSTAVKNAIEGDISNLVPATMLQNHPQATLYLDVAAASQLS